jgi:hypothetical protein
MKIVLSIFCAVFFIYDIYWFHRFERAKDLIHIQRVVAAANLAVAQSPGLMRRIQGFQQIDYSDCPRDFQEAWVAYVEEQTDLANQNIKSFILDVGTSVAVASGPTKGAVKLDSVPTLKSGDPVPQPAKERLLRVIFKYKKVCPN